MHVPHLMRDPVAVFKAVLRGLWTSARRPEYHAVLHKGAVGRPSPFSHSRESGNPGGVETHRNGGSGFPLSRE